MVGEDITNCISIFRKMALPIESLALTHSSKMALLRESTNMRQVLLSWLNLQFLFVFGMKPSLLPAI
jgi:hypothetical protein